MKLMNSTLLMATGGLHTAVGALELKDELAAIWHDGLFASIDPAVQPLRMAMLWFFVAGFFMFALAASYRVIEAQAGALPASFGVWLTFLGLSVVVPLPASGGWLLFPQAALIFVRASRRAARDAATARRDRGALQGPVREDLLQRDSPVSPPGRGGHDASWAGHTSRAKCKS